MFDLDSFKSNLNAIKHNVEVIIDFSSDHTAITMERLLQKDIEYLIGLDLDCSVSHVVYRIFCLRTELQKFQSAIQRDYKYTMNVTDVFHHMFVATFNIIDLFDDVKLKDI